MNKPRQLKPFTELDRLSDEDLRQLWEQLHSGLGYDRAVRHLGAEHFVSIRRHRLISWWQRETVRRGLNERLPESDRLAPADFLKLLNGISLPWSNLMHSRILAAAFTLTGQPNPSPTRLLALQRIANNEFHQSIAGERQHIARERLHLEKRRLRLREKKDAAQQFPGDLANLSDFPGLDPEILEGVRTGRLPLVKLEQHVFEKKILMPPVQASEPLPTSVPPVEGSRCHAAPELLPSKEPPACETAASAPVNDRAARGTAFPRTAKAPNCDLNPVDGLFPHHYD